MVWTESGSQANLPENQQIIQTRLDELKLSPDGEYGDDAIAKYDCQLPTLEEQSVFFDNLGTPKAATMEETEVKNAVLVSSAILSEGHHRQLMRQFGLFGVWVPSHDFDGDEIDEDKRLFHITNIPSFFICGVQGSGKSHSMCCLLENCLVPSPALGVLQKPLSAIVFHFAKSNFRPCEAAFLARPNNQFPGQQAASSINILVSSSNLYKLRKLYAGIEGVTVRPLKLQPKVLNISSLLTLMSVDQTESPPLYLSHITMILRDMAQNATNDGFNFRQFKRRLTSLDLTPGQRQPLELRMQLLESFLELDEKAESCFNFEPGVVTVIDLSCPFVDESTACVLFNICMGVYLEDKSQTGKLIAVDEAHRYITDTPASKVLTESLLSVIRLQRHYGVRVLISTQEPTISPKLMDLCSVTLIHRFTSPEWYNTLRKHVSIFENGRDTAELFKEITNLRVGEALAFAPSALVGHPNSDDAPRKLGSELLKIKIRKRLTWDGGKSIVCV